MSEPARTSLELGYEKRDITMKVVAGIAAIVAVSILICWITPRFLLDQPESSPVDLGLLEEIRASGAPLLQTTPQRDYQQFIRRDREHLHSFGWIDRQRGVVHVPIDYAMRQQWIAEQQRR